MQAIGAAASKVTQTDRCRIQTVGAAAAKGVQTIVVQAAGTAMGRG